MTSGGEKMSLQINCTQDGLVRYPMHKHKNYEIMLYLEGKGHLSTEQGNFPFERGTVIIVPPFVSHGSVSENGFKNISIEGDFEAYLHLERVTSLEDTEAGEGSVLAKLIYDNRYGIPSYLNSLCNAYLCFLAGRIEVENTVHHAVQRIALEISENAFDPSLELSLILSKSGYSEDYIRACFKRITGSTPTEFLSAVRIKHACFMIDVYKNELTLTQIAEQCGYLDYVYFSKKFKQITGSSPREYKGQ